MEILTWMTHEDTMLSENKPVTKWWILYDSIYMRYLEQLNSETESTIEWWLLEAGGRGEWRVIV